MLRLLISTIDESDYRAIASRLRGASAVWSGGSPSREPAVDQYDAALVLRPGWDAPADIGRYLRSGKAVLLAEPWRVRADMRQGLLAEASARGVGLTAANPERYLPSRRAIHQELTAGRLGRLGLVRIHRWLSGPNPRFQIDDHAVFGPLDLALWLFGSRPEVVFATGATSRTGDCFQIHLGFAGGGMALIGITKWLPAGSGYNSLAVIGSAGAAYADDQQNVQLVLGGGIARAHLADERAAAVAAMAQDFVDGQCETPNRMGIEDMNLRAVCAAVAASFPSRQAVRVEGA